MALKNELTNLKKDEEYNNSNKRNGKSVGDTINAMFTEQDIQLVNITDKLKWDLICDRYTNDFDYDPEQDKALKSEIKEFGLQHAIIVVDINKYLTLKNVSDEAKSYYENAKLNGFRYYILSGHRRSRAIMSLCYENQVGLDKKEFYEWYKKEFKDLDSKDAENKNPWAVVKVQEYTPRTVEEEERLTQIENFSNRVIKTFTWVYNSYKLLSEKEKVTAEDVTKYVNKNYGVELSSKHIGNYLTVIKTFKDQRYIQAILHGVITPQTAKKLTSFYKNKLNNNDVLRDTVIKELHKNTTNQDKYVDKLIGKNKKNKTIIKKEKLTKKAVINLIEKVESKEITLDEFKKIINDNY